MQKTQGCTWDYMRYKYNAFVDMQNSRFKLFLNLQYKGAFYAIQFAELVSQMANLCKAYHYNCKKGHITLLPTFYSIAAKIL